MHDVCLQIRLARLVFKSTIDLATFFRNRLHVVGNKHFYRVRQACLCDVEANSNLMRKRHGSNQRTANAKPDQKLTEHHVLRKLVQDE